jgi:hypothetical protein
LCGVEDEEDEEELELELELEFGRERGNLGGRV